MPRIVPRKPPLFFFESDLLASIGAGVAVSLDDESFVAESWLLVLLWLLLLSSSVNTMAIHCSNKKKKMKNYIL